MHETWEKQDECCNKTLNKLYFNGIDYQVMYHVWNWFATPKDACMEIVCLFYAKNAQGWFENMGIVSSNNFI